MAGAGRRRRTGAAWRGRVGRRGTQVQPGREDDLFRRERRQGGDLHAAAPGVRGVADGRSARPGDGEGAGSADWHLGVHARQPDHLFHRRGRRPRTRVFRAGRWRKRDAGCRRPARRVHRPRHPRARPFDVLFANWESAVNPIEIVRIDPATRKREFLTSFNTAKAASIDWRPLRDFWFTGRDGRRIHSFVALPPNFDETKKYPLFVLDARRLRELVARFDFVPVELPSARASRVRARSPRTTAGQPAMERSSRSTSSAIR